LTSNQDRILHSRQGIIGFLFVYISKVERQNDSIAGHNHALKPSTAMRHGKIRLFVAHEAIRLKLW
jgi:hypothetical protein